MAGCGKNRKPNRKGNLFAKGLIRGKTHQNNWSFQIAKIEKIPADPRRI